MPMSMKNMLLLVKQEVTFNVDPVPTAAANAILARGMTPKPISAEMVDRPLIRGFKGNSSKLAVGVHREFEFEVELAGAGAAGTAPKWAPLLMACDFSQTLTAGVSAAYQPVSNGGSSVTIYGYLDGLLFKLTGGKGTVSFDTNAKAIPVMKFKFFGEYSPQTDTILPSGAVFTGFQKPLTVGKVNTPTFSIFGQSGVCSALSFDVANALSWRENIGAAYANSADRAISGSATIELPSTATLNLGELLRNATEGPLQLVHGTVPGNIVQFDAPKVQLTSDPTISDDTSVAMAGLSFSLNPNTGNDELVLTVK
ncbi:Phage tail tube protein-like [Comamonadaceae bacterium]